MSDRVETKAMNFQPSLAIRTWLRLGFRYSARADRPDDDEACYTVHRTITKWDWRDRLRIMVSGITETELCVEVETKTLEKIKSVRSCAVVLAPGARF